mmetsp:Transcript_1003/g.1379  ORF Transcript_1003/g.1379 Transcript_1003/m.1379 type:complete len:84 (-) Transcript_1003:25-276(-)
MSALEMACFKPSRINNKHTMKSVDLARQLPYCAVIFQANIVFEPVQPGLFWFNHRVIVWNVEINGSVVVIFTYGHPLMPSEAK